MTKIAGFVLALDFRHGCSTASVDWGWKQVGYDLFERPNMEIVRVLPERADFRGLRGFPVFFGYRWFDRPDKIDIQEALAHGAIVEKVAYCPKKWDDRDPQKPYDRLPFRNAKH